MIVFYAVIVMLVVIMAVIVVMVFMDVVLMHGGGDLRSLRKIVVLVLGLGWRWLSLCCWWNKIDGLYPLAVHCLRAKLFSFCDIC